MVVADSGLVGWEVDPVGVFDSGEFILARNWGKRSLNSGGAAGCG